MSTYTHKVQYYETDKMGITHHSNYLRFMEEARVQFLDEVGYPMTKLETMGITIPVVSASCKYKHPTTFGDEIEIETSVIAYSGVRLTVAYEMRNKATGMVVVTASSVHCMLDQDGTPIRIKHHFPDLDATLQQMAQENSNS